MSVDPSLLEPLPPRAYGEIQDDDIQRFVGIRSAQNQLEDAYDRVRERFLAAYDCGRTSWEARDGYTIKTQERASVEVLDKDALVRRIDEAALWPKVGLLNRNHLGVAYREEPEVRDFLGDTVEPSITPCFFVKGP